jgi:hypothetical protein
MKALELLFPIRRLWQRDASAAQRAVRIWLATGSVPVAHMVADLDWTAEYSATELRPCHRTEAARVAAS